jgi:hypothetical protein
MTRETAERCRGQDKTSNESRLLKRVTEEKKKPEHLVPMSLLHPCPRTALHKTAGLVSLLLLGTSLPGPHPNLPVWLLPPGTAGLAALLH